MKNSAVTRPIKVAFDQSELGELLNDGCNEIFLCGSNTFRIPLRMKNKKYIGIGEGGVNVKVMPPDKVNELESFGIAFKNVIINGKHVSSLGAVETSKKSSAPERDRNSESSFREIEPSSKSSTVDSDELFELGCSSFFDKKDPVVALKYFKQAEKLGSAAAVNMIGKMYEQGWGVEADLYKAMEYFRRAAEAGDIDALLNLADHYRSGDGFKQDSRKALELYKRAADAGNVDALINMADMYYNGDGVRQDKHKAFELLKQAADAGNADAMENLGEMFLNGEGVAQDIERGRMWIEKSIELGNYHALIVLGNYRAKKKEFQEAFKCYHEAFERTQAGVAAADMMLISEPPHG